MFRLLAGAFALGFSVFVILQNVAYMLGIMWFGRPLTTLKFLDKLTVSELAELSKAYISQVKHGHRPPSRKLLNTLEEQVQPNKETVNYYAFKAG